MLQARGGSEPTSWIISEKVEKNCKFRGSAQESFGTTHTTRRANHDLCICSMQSGNLAQSADCTATVSMNYMHVCALER